MSYRAEALGDRVDQAAHAWAEFAESASCSDWQLTTLRDGQTVGGLLQHVVALFNGTTAPNNGMQAGSEGVPSREVAIDMLRSASHEAAEAVRRLSDAELDALIPGSFHAGPELTAQFVIEDRLVRQVFHHLVIAQAACAGARDARTERGDHGPARRE